MIILIIGIMRNKVFYWFLGMGYSVVLDACLITFSSLSPDYMPKMAYVHGPIAATLSMNILLFILTAVNIWRTGDDAASTLKTRQKKQYDKAVKVTANIKVGDLVDHCHMNHLLNYHLIIELMK